MSLSSTWYSRFSRAALALLAGSGVMVVLLMVSVFQPRVLAWVSYAAPPTLDPSDTAHGADASEADHEKRIAAAIADMEKKAAGQQTLIGSLATLTGLYVVILSAAAYFRLQQTKDETAAADARLRALEERAIKDRDAFQARITAESKEFMQRTAADSAEALRRIKLDIPAMHGIGRRLEELRIELDQRLPVDGDWSYAYEQLSESKRQQALIDEMVINSLDLFTAPEESRDRRTVSRLYTSLGQFYFGRASACRPSPAKTAGMSLNEIDGLKANAKLFLIRARIYLRKANEVDDTDPVSLRGLGTAYVHEATWKKEDLKTSELDEGLMIKATAYYDRSLLLDADEPGACMGRAWLYAHHTPPAYADAVVLLSRIVDGKTKSMLSSTSRKFMSSIYFNRAAYKSHLLDEAAAKGGSGLDAGGEIERDLREGFAATKDEAAAEYFRKALKSVDDFDGLCRRDLKFAGVVAEIIGTT